LARLTVVFTMVITIALLVTTALSAGIASAQTQDGTTGDGSGDGLGVDITSPADARDFAVDMLDSAFPASAEAAAAALSGSPEDFDTYVESGRVLAQNQDLRSILATISAISGPKVQDRVTELLSANDGAGDTEAIAEFVDSGWAELQAEDDRATAWEAAESRDGSSVKAAADTALRTDTPEALADFAATGLDNARAADARREVYELTRSELPSVAAGAAEAIQTDTDTAIDGFLRYGQYVAAAQDTEKMTISQLVDMSITQAGKAAEANSLAVQQADRAARAADNARQAALRARDEAQAADAAQVRAGNAAAAAGQLAQQSARVADQAVAASQEARIALQQTADALARAASAAAQARNAAAVAAARASDASRDAGAAQGARIAAEQARDAADAAARSEEAFARADESAGYAQAAAGAANSAAGNADAAAAAATEAAGAAGVSEQAAAEAREGAARARAAAGRARAAANQVDGLVVRIKDLVAQAREAAAQAADHARKSAVAAEDAAREAGNADYAARMSGVHAADAAAAATAADEAMDLAEQTSEVSTAVADDRLEAERAFLRAQAEDARAVQDATDAAAAQKADKDSDLRAEVDKLTAGDGIDDVDQLRRSAVAAVQVGSPAVAGAAKTALAGGSDDDFRVFGAEGFIDAAYTDDLAVVQNWSVTNPDEAVRDAAMAVVYEDADTIDQFITTGADGLLTGELTKTVWTLRESAGDNTRAAADDALRAGTFESLNGFVNDGGYQNARWADQIQQAYELTRTGGPEVKAAAEAAVVGDRAGLDEFITVEQYRRANMDGQRATHDTQIASMLQAGRQAADVAGELAANAQAAHEHALGSAARAQEFADAAASFAGQAQESARLAGEHLASAEQSLQFAKAQQARAHQAADQAEADATQAESNANQAMSFAVDARASATEAASSAAAARASADAAGQDAALAAQAASDAYNSAWQKQLSEEAELQRALAAEAQQDEAAAPTSLLDTMKDVIGKEALDLILDVVGITDIQNCFKGQISGCIWAAVGALPFGKMFKIAKAMPALRKLVSKAGDIRDAFKARKARVSPALDKVTTPPGCLRRAGFTGNETYRFATAGEAKTTDTQFKYADWRAPWSGFSQVADKCNIPDTVVFTPQGRPPTLARYAGKGLDGFDPPHRAKIENLKGDYSTFRYKETGYPDFSPWIAKHPETGKPLRLENFDYRATSSQDMIHADKLAGITEQFRKDNGWTWHHSEIKGVMELVPTELNANVYHTGGRAMWSPDAKPLKPKTDTKDASWITSQAIFERLSPRAASGDSPRLKNRWDSGFPKVTGSSSARPAAGTLMKSKNTVFRWTRSKMDTGQGLVQFSEMTAFGHWRTPQSTWEKTDGERRVKY